MPKVSVLMPVYKTREVYLREAIESILNQSFGDFEFLILDDCPEDSREEIVRSYSDSRIKYLKNERNLGISGSRNKLLDLAEGEYLAIFDHDDISRPDRLRKEADYLDAHPEVGVVSSWICRFPWKKVFHNPVDDHDIKVSLTEHCIVAHSASMIRKSVLAENNIRYEKQFTPAEDYGMWYRLMAVTKFHNLPEVLFDYRWHNSNTSKIQCSRMVEMTRRMRALIQESYPVLRREYVSRARHVSLIHLFGIVPLFKIVTSGYERKVYLFSKILLLKQKTSSHLGEK